jgi:hypothetical protein
LAVIATGIAVIALTSQDTAAVGPTGLDVVASAHAGDGMTQRADSRSGLGRLPRGGHARSTATASASCTGCEGRARTVQVVYADGPQVAADNVAVAWSSCVDCGASAVAVQVVLLGRRTSDVAVANRALALNAACEGCATSALAVQFVIGGDQRRELTAQARARLAELAFALQEDLETPWPGRRPTTTTEPSRTLSAGAPSPEERAVAEAAESLRRDFGEDAVTVHLDVRHA